ncbi:polyhydroxyalkanoic acid synthase [Aquincola sp. S2]|uniref:Polyhydroxyalkanoic acid synthase n=1 Tax=Pseudaquabacterium terrae TaxID=2732868 RepID=A0ABX2EEN2_9BURK|nr:alpha/beta fold hydrolase [Aquabacterium terrae]NRF67082.1 polyhydroxyalkanoic acid synthase [Aquabacterium terrae]
MNTNANQTVSETQDFDRELRAQAAQMTAGLAPSAFTSAWADWAMHLALSPDKQRELQVHALQRTRDTWAFALQAWAGQPLAPTAGLDGEPDRRFEAQPWWQFPFNVYARAYQNNVALMKDATDQFGGVTDYHAQLLGFAARLLADAASPSNALATNPELLAQTQSEQGQNLMRGWEHLAEDIDRTLQGMKPAGTEAFVPGKSVAVTPGKVVFRNELIELIQYAPATKETHAEPILIVPAWIMKYYILDLSPRNSLVKYLVDQGHTVFMMSWKNPDESDRALGMEDYLRQGLFAALDAVAAIAPKRPVHAVGYCIGGTLLAIGAAALGRERDPRIGSVTMFAAQTDFSEPGELASFINPSQLAMLEATMHKKGVLESRQMGGAFTLLRAHDLLWQPIVDNYLKGQRTPMIDLMAWNADGTRMPWRMHSEYLYRLYMDNELATNRFAVGGRIARLSDITVPMFLVGTEADHVAPWKSVYKLDNLVRSDDFTFLLTAGGHNAGIVSGPVHPKRHYRIKTRRLADPHLAPQEWEEEAPLHAGSWWPAWQGWLAQHSSAKGKPPAMGAATKGYKVIEDAPGQNVLQR